MALAVEDSNASVSPITDGTVLSFVSANLTRSYDFMDITGKANITDEQIFENMLNNTGNIQHAHNLVLQMIDAKPKINAKPMSWAKKSVLFDNTADSKHRKLPIEKVVAGGKTVGADHDTDHATLDTDEEQRRQRNMLFVGGSVALPILFLLCACEGGHTSQKTQKANSPRVDGPDDDYWAEKYEVG